MNEAPEQLLAESPASSIPPIIPVPTPPEPTAAELVANGIVEATNAQVPTRVNALRVIWETLWENPRATAEEIFAVLGSRGGLVLLAGQLAVQDLTAIASAINTTPEALLGDAKYMTVGLPVDIGQDGTVTIIPPV